MPNYKNVTGPISRLTYANPNHPMNTPADKVKTNMRASTRGQPVTGPKSRPKRPARARQVYTGQTGIFSSD